MEYQRKRCCGRYPPTLVVNLVLRQKSPCKMSYETVVVMETMVDAVMVAV